MSYFWSGPNGESLKVQDMSLKMKEEMGMSAAVIFQTQSIWRKGDGGVPTHLQDGLILRCNKTSHLPVN